MALVLCTLALDRVGARQTPSTGSTIARAKIGVLPFVDATASGGADIGVALSRLVQAEMIKSMKLAGRIIPLESISPGSLDAEKAAELGRQAGVDAVLLGTVLEAATEESSKGGWTPSILGSSARLDVRSVKAKVTLQGVLINVTTAEALATLLTTGKESNSKFAGSVYTTLGAWDTDDGFLSSPLGKALQKAVADLVRQMSEKRIPSASRPTTESTVTAPPAGETPARASPVPVGPAGVTPAESPARRDERPRQDVGSRPVPHSGAVAALAAEIGTSPASTGGTSTGSAIASVPSASASSSLVPLREGLTIVTALFNEELGDRESVKTITSVRGDAIQIGFISRREEGDLQVFRTVRREDLKSAHQYRAAFSTSGSEIYPGTTALGTSAAVLTELKAKQRVSFSIDVTIDGELETLRGVIAGAETRRFPVLLNDERVELPVVRASGTLGNRRAEFLFLDDVNNPLALQFRIGDEKLDVVRISYPTDLSRIERALTTARRVDVYGIQFDFGSDRIRTESEPVLKEIADVLRKNATWKVSIEGHTDNIGSDADNQNLSERRVAAVKEALVRRYRIGTGRLTTAGYGESQPKDTNDTLQGRARNRRVELVLQ